MPTIVICCRTSDAFGISGRIYDRLVKHFGRGNVFLDDVDRANSANLKRFPEIQDRARRADILLASIGQNWLNGIEADDDPVRLLLRAALESGVVVTPVLVNGAAMPDPSRLPADIRNFAYRNAAEIDPGSDFEQHIGRLIHSVEGVIGAAKSDEVQQAPPLAAAPQSGATIAPVFISHSSLDRKIAETLVQAIESRGPRCWISTRDIAGGENYQAAIVRALRGSKVIVLVFSENANNSDDIKKEMALASRYRVTVIPIRIEDVLPNEALDFELATRQWIDFFGGWERAMDTLCKRIESLLQG